jgi:hypothetical protein
LYKAPTMAENIVCRRLKMVYIRIVPLYPYFIIWLDSSARNPTNGEQTPMLLNKRRITGAEVIVAYLRH